MKKYIFLFSTLFFFNGSSKAQSWQQVLLMAAHGAPAMTDGIFFGDTCILLSSGGFIIHTNDFFQTFEIDSTYGGKLCDAMSFPTHDIGYITSAYVQGGLLKTTDRGNTWNPMSTGLLLGSGWGDAFVFTNADTGYAASSASGCFRTTYNAGVTWSFCSLTFQCPKIFRIQFINDSTGFLLSNDDANGTFGGLHVFKTSNYGTTWAEIAYLHIHGFGDLYFTDDTTALATGNQVIRKSIDGGYSFNTVFNSPDLYDGYFTQNTRAISFANHDTGFVAYQSTVYKTYDAGNSWRKTDFAFDTNDVFNQIYFIKAISGTKIIVGCSNGSIYKTETGGGIWSGIKETERDNNLLLYPNPASTQLSIQTNGTAIEQINIYNTTGSLVLSALGSTIVNSQLSIVHLPSGVYIAEIKTKEGSARKRWVKM